MRLPRVSASFAVSIDGKIAARAESSTRFISERARLRILELRAEADAVMVSRSTLEAGDLPLRLPSAELCARRIRSGQSAEPLRVVFSNSGRLRKDGRIFRGGAPVVVFTTKAVPKATRSWLEKVADVRIQPRRKRVDLRCALSDLARDYGVRSAVCEGDAELFRSLVGERLIDRMHITFAPAIIGGADAPTLLGSARNALLRRSIPLRLESLRPVGGEAFATYRFCAKDCGISSKL